MQLLFRQRFFSWFDSYDIYDESGNTVYIVKGELSLGHRLQIYDPAGNILGRVQERVFTFLPKFELYVGDQYVGELRKELSLFRPSFRLDCRGWQVDGNFMEWNYTVTEGARTVMHLSKKVLNWTDTYVMDIAQPEDAFYCLMIVLTIDAAKCSGK